ncbi:MAG: hypothetical protein V4662_13740 [Verrucomicrobiota bacterium]
MNKLTDLLPPFDLGDLSQSYDYLASLQDAHLWEAEYAEYEAARQAKRTLSPA